MELSKEESEEKPKNLWKDVEINKYQVIIFTINNYNIIEFL